MAAKTPERKLLDAFDRAFGQLPGMRRKRWTLEDVERELDARRIDGLLGLASQTGRDERAELERGLRVYVRESIERATAAP